ncbi:MAG: hypothetical protein QM630_01080 [Microbacterium sp.]
MPQTQDIDGTTVMVDFTPRPAATHVSALCRDEGVVPDRRGLWALGPWRWGMLLTGLGLAVTCGVPAAAPVWNGADLGVLISLAAFVAAFIPGKD